MSVRWIDYSGARPDPHDIKRNGAAGVIRYLSEPVPATQWKRITDCEKDAILSAGLDLILNYEWYEGRMLEGASAGAHDGAVALTQARALGYPKGASIYFSHDTCARNDAAVIAYLKAAQNALHGEYNADIYGGIDVVETCLSNGVARYGWQTLAWSRGRVGRAHLYQNGRQWYCDQADENEVRNTPLGSWRNHGPAPTVRPIAPGLSKPTPSRDYQVMRGDNLTFIAIKHHTTVSELVRLNPGLATRPNLIYAGEVIHVPGSAKPAAPPKVKAYRVVGGDSLWAIAQRFHTTVKQIVAWNRFIKNPNLILVGWVLRVG